MDHHDAQGQDVEQARAHRVRRRRHGEVPAGFSAGRARSSPEQQRQGQDRCGAAHPGGTVNRVVLLSNGEYNVHVIGADWPHHVFVNQSFKVVGGEETRRQPAVVSSSDGERARA